jgi:O-antigen ligase
MSERSEALNMARDGLNRALLVGALALASLSLFVAPFRSSAGLRAAAMVLAGGLLFVLLRRTHAALGWRLPQGPLLRMSVLIWAAVVMLYSLTSADPLTSMASWRGDVLTPMLAAAVCYSLVRSKAELNVLFVTLLAGVIVLAAMVVLDPYQAKIVGHEAMYINVGWLSTWFVMLAALLPVAWQLAPRDRLVAQLPTVIAAVAILIGCWYSNNRIVWLCFGAMFVIYAAITFRRPNGNNAIRLALFAVGIVGAIGMFYASSAMRAAQFPDASVDAVSILQKDDRQKIWTAAWATIMEKPLAGHGYSLEASSEALARQFTEPGFRTIFRHAHNIVLNDAIEMGFPGALALLGLFVGLAHAFWQRRNRPGISGTAAVCGLMLVCGFFMRNMTDDFFHRHAALLLGALIGLLLAICDWESNENN